MREIKFREWETERKTMVVGEREEYDDSVGFRFAHEEGGARILMQWTGLKDKNNTEVYEGDIVKCSCGCPHEVIWVQENGGTFIGGMPAFYLSQTRAGYAWTNREEVIGNIYENPELLEDTHAE